jgi:hypothetical protein
MQRKKSISNRLDYRRKEKYKEEKDVIHKRKEEKKPKQRGVK